MYMIYHTYSYLTTKQELRYSKKEISCRL